MEWHWRPGWAPGGCLGRASPPGGAPPAARRSPPCWQSAWAVGAQVGSSASSCAIWGRGPVSASAAGRVRLSRQATLAPTCQAIATSSHGTRHVSSSHITTPNANTSLAAMARPPDSTSGACRVGQGGCHGPVVCQTRGLVDHMQLGRGRAQRRRPVAEDGHRAHRAANARRGRARPLGCERLPTAVIKVSWRFPA